MQSWYWIVILGVLIVFYVLTMVRQKRQEKQNAELMDKFKVGDKVVTHIGVYGKIKRIFNTSYGKVCVLEVGTTNKVDLEIDMRYIAGLDEKVVTPNNSPKTETKEPEKEIKEKSEVQESNTDTEEQPKEEPESVSTQTKNSKKKKK